MTESLSMQNKQARIRNHAAALLGFGSGRMTNRRRRNGPSLLWALLPVVDECAGKHQLTWSERHQRNNLTRRHTTKLTPRPAPVKPQEPRLFHVHAINRDNVGDMFSSPLHYWPALRRAIFAQIDVGQSAAIVIAKYNITSKDHIIVGGGGLLNCRDTWNNNLRLYCRAAACVIWSAGRNTHDGMRSADPIHASELEKISITYRTRDVTELAAGKTMLDASCLHPAFDTPCAAGQSLGHGSYLHSHAFTEQMRAMHRTASSDPILHNNVSSLESVKDFMCRFERVTTSSYHGLLWAVYLERTVDHIAGFSTKFQLLPFRLGVDSGARLLQQCRAENRAFYREHIAPIIGSSASAMASKLKAVASVGIPLNLSFHLHVVANVSGNDQNNMGLWQPGHTLLDPLPAEMAWPALIPKHIHLACRSRTALLKHPSKLIQAWQGLNPGFGVTVHEDADMRRFLLDMHGVEMTNVWDRIPRWAGPIRSDLWRSAYLFRYGGVYTDDDNEPLLPLAHALKADDRFVTANTDHRDDSLNPHLIITVPFHPILNQTFHRIVAAINARAYEAPALWTSNHRQTYPSHHGANASALNALYWSWSIGYHMLATFENLFAPLRRCPSEAKVSLHVLKDERASTRWRVWQRTRVPRVCGLTTNATTGSPLASGVRLFKESMVTIRNATRPVTLVGDSDRRVLVFNRYLGWQSCDGCGHIGYRAKVSLESKRWRTQLCFAECL